MHDVHVFGDSHWRVFFPFVNHGSPGVTHEQDGIRLIDMVANELSGATMYGLMNVMPKCRANSRIIESLESLGGVDNVALVFGEVDVRYHNSRYFDEHDALIQDKLDELLDRYRQFIVGLISTGLVRRNVFLYYGFAYPLGGGTLLQPGIEMGSFTSLMAKMLHAEIASRLSGVMEGLPVHCVIVQHENTGLMVSDDGVHLDPQKTFPLTHELMMKVFDDQDSGR